MYDVAVCLNLCSYAVDHYVFSLGWHPFCIKIDCMQKQVGCFSHYTKTGVVARMGESRGVYKVLVGKSEGKRALGRPRRRWEYNIKLDHQEVEFGSRTGSIWLRICTGGGYL